MPTENAVLDHLQRAREALLEDVEQHNAEMQRIAAEVERLNGAVDEVDAVMSRLRGTGSASARTATSAASTPARTAQDRAPARRRTGTAPAGGAGGGGSIRTHVLEILGSENRDFGLAEIIERIAGLGIQAHDDAVRSITIKLMKDGKVERVGRGQYRLAGRAPEPAAETAAPAAAAAPAEAAAAPEGNGDAGYVPAMNFNQDPGY